MEAENTRKTLDLRLQMYVLKLAIHTYFQMVSWRHPLCGLYLKLPSTTPPPPFSLPNFRSITTPLKVYLLTTDQLYTNINLTVLALSSLSSTYTDKSLHILSLTLYLHKFDILSTYPIPFQYLMDLLIVRRLSNLCMK
jgi:hypothetical protein